MGAYIVSLIIKAFRSDFIEQLSKKHCLSIVSYYVLYACICTYMYMLYYKYHVNQNIYQRYANLGKDAIVQGFHPFLTWYIFWYFEY